jgi:hypothetical protein
MIGKFCLYTVIWLSCFVSAVSKNFSNDTFEYPQEIIDTAQSTDPFYNYAAWGLSYAVSDVTGQGTGFMFSMLYGYRLSSVISCEASLHFLRYARTENSYSHSLLPDNTISFESTHYSNVTQTMAMDITGLVYPFGYGQNFIVGAGISGRWGASIRNFVQTKQGTADTYSSFYTNQFALGANVKVEYIVPLNAILDVGFRLGGQLFFPPVQVQGNNIPLGYFLTPYILPPFYGATASLGAFLRLNF